MGPCLLVQEHLFCLSHRKTRWTMSVDNTCLEICLLGTSNSMVTMTFFSSVWTEVVQDKFNNQSHILEGFETTSRSMV